MGRLFRLRSSNAVQARHQAMRQAARFAAFFANAQTQVVSWAHLAVLPAPHFVAQRLVALQDKDGYTHSLGIVLESNPTAREVTMLVSHAGQKRITTLRVGDTFVDPETFRDRIVGPGNG